MGCGSSSPAGATPQAEKEVKRLGVPARVEVPLSRVAWRSCTVGKKLGTDLGIANAFELRVDNDGPMLRGVLKKPTDMIDYAAFTEWKELTGDDGDEDEDEDALFERFKLVLPSQAGEPIKVMLLGHDGLEVEGRLCGASTYNGGERLLVLLDDCLQDATVVGASINHGTLHELKVGEDGGAGHLVTMDLNNFNHSPQTFDSAAKYEEARLDYLQALIKKLSFVEDAITGNMLNVEDQLVAITVEPGVDEGITDMKSLAERMLVPSPERTQGTHVAQCVLVRAGPGTGKTVSLQQLTSMMAKTEMERAKAGGGGMGHVPILLSVQRLASHMKARGSKLTADGADLLREYIDAAYSGVERDILLQAYQMRALVCAIDGVDEAAGLKTRVEDLVLKQLAPMGVRTVVSSRPEGVRLDKKLWDDWLVLNLSPLSDKQQKEAIGAQLKESAHFEYLSSLTKLRREHTTSSSTDAEVAAALAKHGGAPYAAIAAHLASSSQGSSPERSLLRVLDLFDEASLVPVLLSMLALCLETLAPSTPLPMNRLELYQSSVRAAIRRRCATAEDVAPLGRLLARLAVSNHVAQRREFTSLDVEAALTEKELALWRQLEALDGGVPLIKVLEVGDPTAASEKKDASLASKYQFKHLSFQEAFFAEALCEPSGRTASSNEIVTDEIVAMVQSVWARGALKLLNDRWLLNTFAICGGTLGASLGSRLGSAGTDAKMTEHQVKSLVALEWAPLRGWSGLTRLSLTCGTGTFGSSRTPGVARLVALLADPKELSALTCIEFGAPVSGLSVEVAAAFAAASTQRRNFRLCGKVDVSQFDYLGPAEAVFIAATLRNVCSTTAEVQAETASFSSATGRSKRLVIGSDGRTLADVLTAAGVQASSVPKDLAAHALLAGFSASDMRSGMRLSTADLVDAGCAAGDIAASLGGGAPSSATLRELGDAALSLELAVDKGVDAEELRKAGADVPSPERMEDAVGMVKCLGSIEKLKTFKGPVDASKLGLSDTNGAALLWAMALHCGSSVTEIVLSRNSIGNKTAIAIAQYLRYNSSCKLIDLHDNKVGDAGAAALAKSLTGNGTLESLRLTNNDVTSSGAAALCEGVTRNHVLKTLALETGANVMSPGIDLHPLKGLVTADNVDIASRNFGPLSTLVISRLVMRYRPQIIEFAILKNGIHAEGAAEVAEMLKVNDDIKLLDVRFCALGPKGMSLIGEALLVNSAVDRLLALKNGLGAEGAEVIRTLLEQPSMSLRYIDIQDNLIPPDVKEALEKAATKHPELTLIL